MQVTETERQDSEEVYRMIGEAVLMLADNGLETTRLRIAGFIRRDWSERTNSPPEMKTLMESTTNWTTYPDSITTTFLLSSDHFDSLHRTLLEHSSMTMSY